MLPVSCVGAVLARATSVSCTAAVCAAAVKTILGSFSRASPDGSVQAKMMSVLRARRVRSFAFLDKRTSCSLMQMCNCTSSNKVEKGCFVGR